MIYYISDGLTEYLQQNKTKRRAERCGAGVRRLAQQTGIVPAELEFDCRFTTYKCRHKDKLNRKSQSEFECVSCGHSDIAEINSAKNILAFRSRESLNGRGNSKTDATVKRQKWDGSVTVKFSINSHNFTVVSLEFLLCSKISSTRQSSRSLSISAAIQFTDKICKSR